MRTLLVLLLALGCFLLWTGPASAGPVAPIVATLTQPDGTSFPAQPFGDEWLNGYETLDGHTILQDVDGVWRFAVRDTDGNVQPGLLRPDQDDPAGVAPHVRGAPAAIPDRSPYALPGLAGHKGNERVLVILVAFPDRPPVGSTAADWETRFFGATDSIKHYYNEVSYGQLTLLPAAESSGTANDGIVDWVTLPYNHPNTGDTTNVVNRQLAKDAILAADPYVNFASYDTNGDGALSNFELHVVTIIAGYEASYGGAAAACAPSVWAHWWTTGGDIVPPVVDGVRVGAGAGAYTQFGEWHCHVNDNPGHLGTIGQMAHEMGHDLRWPDLYDTDNSSEGVGYWSVMATGAWLKTTGYQGSMPAHPDAFSKWYQGWLTPEQVTGSQNGVQIQQVETNQRVIQLLDNPGRVDWLYGGHTGNGEYFLIENRQKTGYDAGLRGCGLLVWHIDETQTQSNSANATDSRRLVDLEEADGLGQLDSRASRGDAGDPYPGTTLNLAFNDTSNPNSRLYSLASSGVAVSVVSTACGGTMSVNITAPSGVVTATPTPSATPQGATTPTRTATATPTAQAGGWTTILQDNFEGAWPGQWQLYSPPTSDTYRWAKRTCRPASGGSSAWAIGGGSTGATLACGENYPDDAETWLYTSPFSLVGATAAELSFDVWYNSEDGYDEICWLAATGDTYYGTCESGDSGGWVNRRLDLSNIPVLGNLLGQPQVSVALMFRSDYGITTGEGAYVDNVVLRKQMPLQVTPTRTATSTSTPRVSPTPSRTPGDKRLYLPVIISAYRQ